MKNCLVVLALFAAAGCASAQQYIISTIAGVPGSPGYTGDFGPALAAGLNAPLYIAVDSKRNYYIADNTAGAIRKVAAGTGIITTIAGAGTRGFSGDGGPAIGAEFSFVQGLATDAAGNLYIADTGNSRIRIVDPAGDISTFAGTGARGWGGDGGAAADALLYWPAGLAVDAGGNLYIADYGNGTVRKVSTNGSINTIAGNGRVGFAVFKGDGGPANQASLGLPYSVAADESGEVFIADSGSSSIRKVGRNGIINTVVLQASTAGIAADPSGNLFYSDYRNSVVVKLSPNGVVSTIAGTGGAGYSGDGGGAQYAQLNQPYGIAIDSSGDIYVADSANTVIRLMTPFAAGPISIGAVVNAASESGNAVSPGEIVVVYGQGMGPAGLVVNQPDGNGLFEGLVAGTAVLFDGHIAPLIYTSAGQIAAIVPYAEAIGSTAQVTVTWLGQTSAAFAVPIVGSAPGIFTANASGSGQAAAVNQDTTINNASQPAPRGSFLSLYVTGEGQTNPAGVDGLIASDTPSQPVLPVSVTVGGKPAVVSYAGGAPQEVTGLMQVNVQIPSDIDAGSAVPVVVKVGTVSSPTATIAVQ
jgi:uncharacterized protein (TIGR03437 family)